MVSTDREAIVAKKMTGLVVALALTAAACGGGAETVGVASLDTDAIEVIEVAVAADIDSEEAMLAFTACLREEGMEIEDPEFDEDGDFRFRPADASGEGDFDREAFEVARTVCDEYLEGSTIGFQQEDRSEMDDMLFEYAACMRDNGYDMADPDVSTSTEPGQGGGEDGKSSPFGDIDKEDPAFQSANEVCQEITGGLPTGGGSGVGGG